MAQSTTEKPLINRVANSRISTIDLETLYPSGEIIPFDLKDFLYMELILKEKASGKILQRVV